MHDVTNELLHSLQLTWQVPQMSDVSAYLPEGQSDTHAPSPGSCGSRYLRVVVRLQLVHEVEEVPEHVAQELWHAEHS